MCRLLCYMGRRPVLLEDVLIKPVNSLVHQSLKARETDILTNGDGFGLGWYVPEISDEPALFTSIMPAWSDRNLLSLTSKIKSKSFFAHVRAASAGGVTQYNCHPFVAGRWMWMHNGCIDNFMVLKRHLRHILEDDIYHWIKGDTDSEHLFALWLQLSKHKDLSNLQSVVAVLKETFERVQSLGCQFHATGPSYFNVCLTDGARLIVSRYSTDLDDPGLTMHYAQGERLIPPMQDIQNEALMKPVKENIGCVLVSSECLSNVATEWHMLPPQHVLCVDQGLKIEVQSLCG